MTRRALDDRPGATRVLVEESSAGAVVVKRYPTATAARAVHAVLTALWDSPFGAERGPAGSPRPLGIDDDAAELRMEHVGGAPLAWPADPGASTERAADAGRLLADLHVSGARLARVRDGATISRALRRACVSLPPTTPLPFAMTYRRAAAIASAWPVHRTPLVPTHGAFAPRNVLDAPEGLRAIRLDRAALAPPGRDVATWEAWLWVTLLLAGREPSWEASTPFVLAYVDRVPALLPALARDLPFHRAVALLRIAHGWSALRSRPDVGLAVVREAERVLR